MVVSFDRVNHDILMSRIARRIGDKRLLRIIRRFLQAGMMQQGVGVAREEGAPDQRHHAWHTLSRDKACPVCFAWASGPLAPFTGQSGA